MTDYYAILSINGGELVYCGTSLDAASKLLVGPRCHGTGRTEEEAVWRAQIVIARNWPEGIRP